MLAIPRLQHVSLSVVGNIQRANDRLNNPIFLIALNDDNMVTANTCDCQQVVMAFGEKIECFPTGSEEAERISNSMKVYSKKK